SQHQHLLAEFAARNLEEQLVVDAMRAEQPAVRHRFRRDHAVVRPRLRGRPGTARTSRAAGAVLRLVRSLGRTAGSRARRWLVARTPGREEKRSDCGRAGEHAKASHLDTPWSGRNAGTRTGPGK